MSAPRVGLIGARRVRQGLGPFVARDLRAAGAEVTCVLGTSAASADAAADALAGHGQCRPSAYTDVAAMLVTEDLDALAILCPAEFHETYLAAAHEARLHVLCEKPFVWAESGLAKRAATWVERFRAAGLLLAENCQWPYALPALRSLHPAAFDEPPRHLAMRLSPVSSGRTLLGDTLPHPLSLLQAVAPDLDAGIEEPRFTDLEPDRGDAPPLSSLGVSFRYGPIDVDLELRHAPEPPRPASLALNGYRAEREIRLENYALSLTAGERRAPLPDPLTALVRDFVADLRATCGGAKPPDPAPIARRTALLEALLDAFDGWGPARGSAIR